MHAPLSLILGTFALVACFTYSKGSVPAPSRRHPVVRLAELEIDSGQIDGYVTVR